ncbi:MAG TPA: 3-hydroxyacyl-CoA dehydrogenase NAD-binding domain-containing protein [Frankiaceae bacterium]
MAAAAVRLDIDAEGIATITLDDPNSSANTMNAAYAQGMGAVLEELAGSLDRVRGVVVASAKKTFFAGGDLVGLQQARREDAAAMTEDVDLMKAQLRTLETLGKPVVAAINGAALGGGYEITLACHHRVLADVRGAVVGLPEVTLGLLPGGGGITRLVRMFGIQKAVSEIAGTGKRFKPAEALAAGLVDEVVGSVDELLPAAKKWIAQHPESAQPWDAKGYKIPGGTPANPGFASVLPAFPATLRKQLKGAPMPAPRAILSAAVEGSQVDFDTASRIETRYLVHLATGQVAKNMIQAFWFDLNSINAGGSRPAGFDTWKATKVGVLGAGMMGAAIAYCCARVGIDVVLKDVSPEAAARGKAYAEGLEAKALKRGKTTQEKSDALLARIHPTAAAEDFAGVDLVIEAVFESPEVKRQVFAEIEPFVAADAVLGSNTSTLPITQLAEGVTRPDDFIGIHFFSPADKMPLVEIIRGARTSDAVLAKVIDFVQQIKKTPIVVHDSRGFFTSRVIGTFLNEAVAMVGEGVEPSSIEQAGLQAGYPAGPLQLMDELTLTLPRMIRESARAASLEAGEAFPEHGSYAVIDRMIDDFGRKGRSTGGAFYSYADGKRVGLWSGLREAFRSGTADVPFVDIQERMLFAEALETQRCIDEGVIDRVADANIGSIFGIGFPAWTGGVVQYVEQYPGGVAGFVARARELAGRYGSQFEVPASLVARAAEPVAA